MDAANVEPADQPRFGAHAPEALKRLEAWLSLPAEDRAELLRGRIVYKAMASIEHGDAAGNVFAQLDRFRGPPSPDGGGCWLSQDVDLFLAGQGLRPDLAGWRIANHPRPPQKVNIGVRHLGVYVAVPDWICEVLSPSTRSADEDHGFKWQAYHDSGVGHYWLVDLAREQLTVYRRGARSYEAVEVAAGDTKKPLPPFESVNFLPHRVFLMSSLSKHPT